LAAGVTGVTDQRPPELQKETAITIWPTSQAKRLMSLLAQLGPSAMSALSPLSGEEGHEMCSVRAFPLLTHLGHQQQNFAVMQQRHSTLW
jgi:hypothetical protein